jgi:hypothetical protein
MTKREMMIDKAQHFVSTDLLHPPKRLSRRWRRVVRDSKIDQGESETPKKREDMRAKNMVTHLK